MAFRVYCACGEMLEVGERLRGKQGRCQGCSAMLKLVPNAAPTWQCGGCGQVQSGPVPRSGTLCGPCVARAQGDLDSLLDPAAEPIIDLADFPSDDEEPWSAPPSLDATSEAPATGPRESRSRTGETAGSRRGSSQRPNGTRSRSENASRSGRPNWWWTALLAIPAALVVLTVAIAIPRAAKVSLNPLQTAANIELQSRFDRIVAADSRNAVVRASVYYRDAASRDVLVFDLQELTGGSRIDVFRVLLDFAETTTDLSFGTVQFACRGKAKFEMAGSYFRELGRERDTQNPAFTVRTFPENLRTPEGERAFPEWTGGVLGVLQKQLEDFNTMHDRWYGELLTGGS